MALHGNDPSQFTRADGCTPDNPMLKDTNSLFHNVDLSSHMPTYPVNSYSHNAQLLLKNLSHCAGRPDFCLPSSYHVLGHDNHSEDIQLGAIEQSLDFGHRSGTYNPGHRSYFSDVSTQDLYSERSQSSTGHVVRTRRRKAGGMEEARVCVVCGEPASGYNFDRLTCESCKAFFRRNALKPKEKIKACGRNGDCNIEGSQRKHCPSCRLEKCLAVGMKKELILRKSAPCFLLSFNIAAKVLQVLDLPLFPQLSCLCRYASQSL
uniref:Nuclear receptor domain-containing protein n=1 Tax=Mesocestoides corti TaxID=53468 RepID=A0A5K3EQD6_MESCO